MATEKFGLSLPKAEDYYDISVFNQNFQKLDAGAIAAAGNIRRIQVISRAAFADMTPEADVLYIVTGDKDFSLFYGSLPQSYSGSQAIGTITTHLSGIIGTTGQMVTTETEE